ncbi:hypothetical protein [uncultured Erythrobacter sp.]|uniref:hypothetical protein n=2 Tax=uncultured Erythrobacter sp. TaxID=263913 RepID=UPI002629B5D0|nr:hypothetical protein [uncultured Erythrobacter sp.]
MPETVKALMLELLRPKPSVVKLAIMKFPVDFVVRVMSIVELVMVDKTAVAMLEPLAAERAFVMVLAEAFVPGKAATFAAKLGVLDNGMIGADDGYRLRNRMAGGWGGRAGGGCRRCD